MSTFVALLTVALYLVLVAAVIGLLLLGVWYTEKKLGGEPLLYNVLRVGLVVLGIVAAIFVILDFAGAPVFRFR